MGVNQTNLTDEELMIKYHCESILSFVTWIKSWEDHYFKHKCKEPPFYLKIDKKDINKFLFKLDFYGLIQDNNELQKYHSDVIHPDWVKEVHGRVYNTYLVN